MDHIEWTSEQALAFIELLSNAFEKDPTSFRLHDCIIKEDSRLFDSARTVISGSEYYMSLECRFDCSISISVDGNYGSYRSNYVFFPRLRDPVIVAALSLHKKMFNYKKQLLTNAYNQKELKKQQLAASLSRKAFDKVINEQFETQVLEFKNGKESSEEN